MELPTGYGKSLINIISARYIKQTFSNDYNMYISTPTNFLVDQYEKDFSKYMSTIKGKAQYKCENSDDSIISTASGCDARSLKNCPLADVCLYATSIKAALEDRITFSNLACLLTNPKLTKRNLLFIDEAGSLENALVNFVSFEFTNANKDMFIDIESKILSKAPFYRFLNIDIPKCLTSFDWINNNKLDDKDYIITILKSYLKAIKYIQTNLKIVINDKNYGLEISERIQTINTLVYSIEKLLEYESIKFVSYFNNKTNFKKQTQ
jgi:hypothetical protein